MGARSIYTFDVLTTSIQRGTYQVWGTDPCDAEDHLRRLLNEDDSFTDDDEYVTRGHAILDRREEEYVQRIFGGE